MKLKKVTITGADQNTDVNQLVILQDRYPFVEWGILFSASKEGHPRYPTRQWVMDLPEKLNLSAHLCGQYARMVLEDQNYDTIRLLPPAVKRVQLNYNFQQSTKWNLHKLKLFAESYVVAGTHPAIILQYNKANGATLKKFMAANELPSNIHFLYDSSGGRGTEITDYPPPFKSYTGYAGGLGPDNVERLVSHYVETEEDTHADFWIDMESKVRTDDQFDIEKVQAVLKTCDKYIE